MTQRHFFATADDLLPVFEIVESTSRLCYTATGLFETPRQESFVFGSTLPTLRQPAAEQSASCATYLVTPAEVAVNVRPVQQRAGGTLFAVDQLTNPDSVTFTHGGLFTSEILISGRIATVSSTVKAKVIQSVFSKAIGKLFSRVQSFYVGPAALELLLKGHRLTHSANSPREYDLVRA